MNVLIGSRAAKHWFPSYRNPTDWDYLTLENKKNDHKNKKEYFSIEKNPALEKIITEAASTSDGFIAKPEHLYTLKLSHCFWPIHWEKTMLDIKFFQENGVDYDGDLLDELYKGWEEFHGKKRAYLKKENKDFFTDSVKREYEHDDIHRAIAYYDEPMFEKVKRDKNSAYISPSLFENWRIL